MLANACRAILTKPKFPVLSFQLYLFNTHHSFRFSCLLNSCTSLADLKQVHALILTNGSRHNLLLSTKLLTQACFIAPTMCYARKLFDEMPEKDVFSCNTLIQGYADKGPRHEAILLYRNMHLLALMPDKYTYPSLVRSCSAMSLLREGKEVHCNIIKCGFNFDIFVQSALVSMYSQGGETPYSTRVFGEMELKNVVSWTAMIAGYVQNGLFIEGLNVFRKMIASGMQPNAITLVSILPACIGLEFLNFGMLFHGYGVKLGLDSSISVVNSLIALYGKCGNIHVARYLFDEVVVKNQVTWNAMIAVYEQNNAAEAALDLFFRMQAEKVEFDFVTLVSIISACSRLGALNTGRWVHDLVKRKGLETNVSITNALIDMYAKCGNINLAKSTFDKLSHKSVVSWTSMIGACAFHGHVLTALELFSKMKEEEIRPNILTFTAVLTACRHSGLVEEGRKYFESMIEDYSIVPGPEQCSCMVDLLGRAGCLNEAYEFVKRMPADPDEDVWGALLSACRMHGNVELAGVVAAQVFLLDPQTVTLYVLLSNIYAEAGRWEEVAKLKNLIKEKELRRRPGHSSVDVNKKVYTFLSGSRPCYS